MDTGHLVLFDLNGYTQFLARSELHQAPGILRSLLGTVIRHIEPPLVVVEVEGDAIFSYAPAGGFPDADALLSAIERTYCTFAATREQMMRNAACDCEGCRSVADLDLKVVAHRGAFALAPMLPGTAPKPLGADVVLAHRLLKNHIAEATGIRMYAFLTDACVDTEASRAAAGAQHQEAYDTIGVVRGFVHDLAHVWSKERSARLVRVEREDTWLEAGIHIDASLEAVWRVVDRPAFRSLWRRDTDAQHCFTGETIGVDEIFDRDPLHHLTFEVDDAFRLTARLTPEVSGTRLSVRITRPKNAADEDRAGITIDLFGKLAIVRRWARMDSAIPILPSGS